MLQSPCVLVAGSLNIYYTLKWPVNSTFIFSVCDLLVLLPVASCSSTKKELQGLLRIYSLLVYSVFLDDGSRLTRIYEYAYSIKERVSFNIIRVTAVL